MLLSFSDAVAAAVEDIFDGISHRMRVLPIEEIEPHLILEKPKGSAELLELLRST